MDSIRLRTGAEAKPGDPKQADRGVGLIIVSTVFEESEVIVPFRIVTIGFDPSTECFRDEDLNRFCINKRVKMSRPAFFLREGEPFWTVFVEYETVEGEETESSADDMLDEKQQLLLKRIKEWRKATAEERGVPVYVVCTNKQAVNLVRVAPKTVEALKNINGFGKKKIQSYGKEIIDLIHGFGGDEDA